MQRKANSGYLIFLLFGILMLAGCASTSSSATQIAPPTELQATLTTVSTQSPTETPIPITPTADASISTPQNVSLSPNGPWLIYLHDVVSSIWGETDYENFAVLNQDGSGRTTIKTEDPWDTKEGENSANELVITKDGFYIFQLSNSQGMPVCRNQAWYYSTSIPCRNARFTGDQTGGLLAEITNTGQDSTPLELIIRNVPERTIRNRIPLIKCPAKIQGCEGNKALLEDMGYAQEIKWSPNGRYLAFKAVMGTTSSDLYIYDKEDGKLRQLTNGPDWVGQYWWSADGAQIIMTEIPKEQLTLSPSESPPMSIWSVSVSNNKIKELYSLDYQDHHILSWLDDESYFAYDGDLVHTAGLMWALRLVNTRTGEVRKVFSGQAMEYEFDKIHETFAILTTEGTYLVSIKNSTVRKNPFYGSFEWNEEIGLFVTYQDCKNDPAGYQAFDYLGNFRCMPKPNPTPESTQTRSRG